MLKLHFGGSDPLSGDGARFDAIAAGPVVVQHALNYAAGPGGTIQGSASQSVPTGGSGTAVTAEADPGAAFDRWSDGVLTSERTGSSIASNLSVTAHFQSAGGVPIDWYDLHDISLSAGET